MTTAAGTGAAAPWAVEHVVHVFIGPTAHGLDPALLADAALCLHPPARRGSVAQLLDQHPRPAVIVLVDGRYDDVPAVGHREILDALAHSWQVWGLGSMGALRAIELEQHGMRGYGAVVDYLGTAPDDHVALLHGPPPDYQPLSEAFVDLAAHLHTLHASGALTAVQATAVGQRLDDMWFGQRTAPAFVAACRDAAGDDAAAHARSLVAGAAADRAKTRDLIAFLTEQPWCPPAPPHACPN